MPPSRNVFCSLSGCRACKVERLVAKHYGSASFLVFWAHSKAVSRFIKNDEEGHRAFFSRFLGAFRSGVTKHQK